jgi:uncharacterized protein
VLALFALVFAFPARAAFKPPPLDGHVVDTAGKLSDSDILDLDKKLDQIRQQSGLEIVAFIAGSLEGETIEDVAYEAFNAWGIGRKGQDNGVLLVIAPAERRVRIETGNAVGGALTDLQSNDIIRNTINPLLREDRFRDAIDQGTVAIARTLLQGTPEGSMPKERPDESAPASPARPFVLLGLGALVLILSIVSPGFRRFLLLLLLFGGRGGGGGGFSGRGGGSGYRGGGGRSGGGGSSDSY